MISRTVLALVLAALPALAPQAGAAPSFDCAKAGTAFEKAVCASETLSRYDREIAAAYAAALKTLAGDEAALTALKTVQRAYIAAGAVALDTRMELQRDFLRGLSAATGSGLAGIWSTPHGDINLKRKSNGRLEVNAASTTGLPPDLRSCEWEGSDVAADEPVVVSRSAGDWGLRLTRKGLLVTVEELPPPPGAGRKEPLSKPHCAPGGSLAGLYFASRALPQDKPVAPPTPSQTDATATREIRAYLSQLPASAFDDTTEGIEASELRTLVETGESANWRMTDIRIGKAVFQAKRPSSTLTVVVKNADLKPLLAVRTENQKAVSYGYFRRTADGSALESFRPHPIARARNELSFAETGLHTHNRPYEVVTLADRLEKCQHWAGEVSDDLSPERRQTIVKTMRDLDCAGLPRREKEVRAKFARDREMTSLIDKIKQMIGD